ncbi:RNA 2',3'-cyclic phosphodiesterase [Pseudomonas sp. BMS12]|uniref:RNA 2',3'-cyclic phosphodiesterase n=1 Tax=Pseudomonas sp. BMS12 TaxID=1796033 RepID=UPI00083A098B|nr:RNA 2',3'-cyclic phosphodiesterase [Pseudomonas sp. BMS12]
MSEKLRLFFALPVPEPLAAHIADWRQQLACDGALVHPEDLHLTLVFLGSQPAARLPELQALTSQLRGEQAFELQLDQLGCWRGGLLHLAPSQPPTALLRLQRNLQDQLTQAGFTREERGYRPHLSLARQAQAPTAGEAFQFTWRVDSFALFSSQFVTIGPRYRLIDTWPLH